MKTTIRIFTIIFSILIAVFLFACSSTDEAPVPVTPAKDLSVNLAPSETVFTLKTIAGDGKLLYIGVGGEIDGIINPDLIVQPGAVVRIILTNGDGMVHDLFLPDFDAKTEYVKKIGDRTEMVFEVDDMQPGSYVYYCTLPGHRKAGQEGKLIISESSQ